MRKELIEKIKSNPEFKEASIDEILRILIDDSDELEVVACLDLILTEKIKARVAAFDWSGRVYPVGDKADLSIPDPDWKLKSNNVADLEVETDESETAEKENQNEKTDQNQTGATDL